jgi:hypothetical protein
LPRPLKSDYRMCLTVGDISGTSVEASYNRLAGMFRRDHVRVKTTFADYDIRFRGTDDEEGPSKKKKNSFGRFGSDFFVGFRRSKNITGE